MIQTEHFYIVEVNISKILLQLQSQKVIVVTLHNENNPAIALEYKQDILQF